MSELTPKQQRFVDEYLIDLNATQAAIRAGYSEVSARSQGHENLTKPDISAAIKSKNKYLLAKLNITPEHVLREYSRIAFGRITDVVKLKKGSIKVARDDQLNDDQKAMLSSISETKYGIKITIHNKMAALDKLGQYLCIFAEKPEEDKPTNEWLERRKHVMELSDTEPEIDN